MWAQYKKTFIPVQIFVVGVCLVFVLAGHVRLEGLIFPVIVMEVGAIYGAKWAWRIKGGKSMQRATSGTPSAATSGAAAGAAPQKLMAPLT